MGYQKVIEKRHPIYSEITNEVQLTKHLIEYWSFYAPKKSHLTGFNLPLYGAMSNKNIGFVDLIFSYRMYSYFVEIKFDKRKGGGDFWESLKVLGYAAAQELASENNLVKPTIMIRESLMCHDYLAIIGKLNLGYILFNISNSYLTLKYHL